MIHENEVGSAAAAQETLEEYVAPGNNHGVALQLAAQGKVEEAKASLRRALKAARDRSGSDSIHYRDVAIELGAFLAQIGDLHSAVEAFREACAEPVPQSLTGLRQNLAAEYQQACCLAWAGQIDDSRLTIDRNRERRGQLFGEEHTSYAVALELLANLQLIQNETEDALVTAEKAVAIFHRTLSPNLGSALALRAIALKALDRPATSFAGLDDLPPGQIEHIARKVIETSSLVLKVKVRRRMFHDLYALVSARLGDDHPVMLEMLCAIADLEKNEGPKGKHRARQETIRQIVALHERQGQEAKAIAALGKLAEAQNDADLFEEARATYFHAVSRAQKRGDMSQLAQTLTDAADFLAAREQTEDAERMFRAGISAGQRGKQSEVLGRAHGAFAVFLQHGGRGAEASEHLNDALRLLPIGTAETTFFLEHQDALRQRVPCPCGKRKEEARQLQYLAAVLSVLPSGIAENIEMAEGESGPEVLLRLSRPLTPDEQQALETFRDATREAFPYRFRITAAESETAHV